MWPVVLKADDRDYNTTINGWKEWDYFNGIPRQRRLSRFVSIVKLQTQYNLTFAAMPPLDMYMQLQKRTPEGNNLNYVIMKIQYPLNNSIRIFVNGIRQSPIITTDLTSSHLRRQLDTSICGDNIYYLKNRTIRIVITEADKCLIKISLADSIQLTTHFAMNASDFMTDSVMANYTGNLAALLGISDQSRIKIVGVHTGSTIVETVIEADNNTNSTPLTSSDLSNISAVLANAINDGTYSSLMETNVGATVLSAS